MIDNFAEIEYLKELKQKEKDKISKLINACLILKNNNEYLVDEINNLVQDRQQFQKEKRYLRIKQQNLQRELQIKEKKLKFEFEKEQQHNLDSQQLKAISTPQNEQNKQQQTEFYQTRMTDEVKKLLDQKQDVMKKKAVKCFQNLLIKGLTNIKESPLDIFHRIHQQYIYNQKNKNKFYSQSIVVIVKMLQSSLFVQKESKNQYNSNNSTLNDQTLSVNKTDQSLLGDKFQKSFFINRQKNLNIEQQENQKEKFKFFQTSFRVSYDVQMLQFKRTVSHYFCIKQRDFNKYNFFDDNGNKIDLSNLNQTVYQIMEEQKNKEFKDKEIDPASKRYYLMYLGNNEFQEKFDQYFKIQLKKKEEQNKIKKEEENKKLELENQDNKFIQLMNDRKPDQNQKFLRIIPEMSYIYKSNKILQEIFKEDPDFRLSNGGWTLPNCCSLLILTLQMILILMAIGFQKGSPQSFFLGDFSNNYLFYQDGIKIYEGIKNEQQLWDWMENYLAGLMFYQSDYLLYRNKTVNTTYLDEWVASQFFHRSWEFISVGPMRIIQYRVAEFPCNSRAILMGETVCHTEYFSPATYLSQDIINGIQNNYTWGKYWNENNQSFTSQTSNTYKGIFGDYPAEQGYKIDFYSYDMQYYDFIQTIQDLQSQNYIEKGATRAINIDFTLLYPSSRYFINVELLIEFTRFGNAITTRQDIAPYLISPFSKHIKTPMQYVTSFKLILLLYTVIKVVAQLRKIPLVQIFTYRVISQFSLELGIILFQTINFILKIQDIFDYDINPKTLLNVSERQVHIEIYFKTLKFKTCLVMEVFSLMLVVIKIFEIFRLQKKMNFITIATEKSIRQILIWSWLFVMFTVIMTVMAQSIWGHMLQGFQTFQISLLNIFMIQFSKIDLQQLLNINIYYSMAFFVMYYVIIVYLQHSVFHFVQTNAVALSAVQYSLAQEYDVVDVNKIQVAKASNEEILKLKKQRERHAIQRVNKSLKWMLFWTGRRGMKLINNLEERMKIYFDVDDDTEEENEQRIHLQSI